MQTVYCVAIESDGSGALNWHTNELAADRQYDKLEKDALMQRETLTRFNIDVDEEADPSFVTNLCDSAMWDLSYQPLRQRIGAGQAQATLETTCAC